MRPNGGSCIQMTPPCQTGACSILRTGADTMYLANVWKGNIVGLRLLVLDMDGTLLTKSAAQAPSFRHGVKPRIAVRR